MSGSAPGLFLCRGCRLHFMLRPACLLPMQRLSPPIGLSTSRSGHRNLSRCLGPATRRSGAYREGASTLWRNAASVGAPGSLFRGPALRRVTTHHGSIIREARPFAHGAPPGPSNNHRSERRKLSTAHSRLRFSPRIEQPTTSGKPRGGGAGFSHVGATWKVRAVITISSTPLHAC